MACAGQLHVGDVGSLIRVTVTECGQPFNAQGGTASMLFQAPDGTVTARSAQPETDGRDGVFVYLTQEGDLRVDGPWRGQVQVILPSGTWTSDTFAFQVAATLNPVVTAAVGARLRVPVASRGGVA